MRLACCFGNKEFWPHHTCAETIVLAPCGEENRFQGAVDYPLSVIVFHDLLTLVNRKDTLSTSVTLHRWSTRNKSKYKRPLPVLIVKPRSTRNTRRLKYEVCPRSDRVNVAAADVISRLWITLLITRILSFTLKDDDSYQCSCLCRCVLLLLILVNYSHFAIA